MQQGEQDRFARVEALFHRAVTLDPVARGAFLDQVCDDDAGTRSEVEALLAAEPWHPAEVDAPTSNAAPAAGLRVGAYRLEAPIGQGGSSVVFRARRIDERYDKAVAIKIRKTGLGWTPGPDRFAAECRILARLEHPGIARLHDAGSLPSGEPYVVMALVPGERITDYCDRRQLSLTRRLALFRQVCDAVDYAHRRLIVHRDLKPSNILVAEDQAVLLDFGIAKLLEPVDLEDAEATVTGLRPMTPQYASPEQIMGEPVGVASDVYSLGLILHELLGGLLPYRFAGRHLNELDTMLTQLDSLPALSAVATQGDGAEVRAGARGCAVDRLRRQLAGDLDAIVGKALRREAEVRYSTAAALAADVVRHLSGHPVAARTGTLRYRARRYARRNRWALTAAAVTLSLLLGLVAAIARQSVLVTRERDHARTVNDFIVDLFEVYNDDAARQAPTVKAMLDEGVRRIESDQRLSTAERATLLNAMGGLYRQVGEAATGLPLIEMALVLRRELFGDQHVDTVNSLVNAAQSHHSLGDWRAARSGYELALTRQQELVGTQHADVAQTLGLLGNLCRTVSEYTLAEDYFRRALIVWGALREAGNPRVLPDHADGLSDLGGLLTFLGRGAEAEPLLREALAIQEDWFGAEHPAHVRTFFDLAELHYGRGHFDEAQRIYREGLALAAQFRTADHRINQRGLNGLGMTLERLGALAEAESVLRRCLALVGENVGTRHADYASTQSNLAGVLRRLGQRAEAESLYQDAYAIRLETLGERHAAVQHSRYSLGVVRLELGDTRAALDLFDQGEAGLDAANLPPEHFSRAFFKIGRGRALVELDRAMEAESVLRAGVAITRAALPADHWRVADAESALGGCLVALGRIDEGRSLLLASLEALRTVGGDDAWTVSWTERWLETPVARLAPIGSAS